MNFYYPNRTNDFWYMMGLVFCGDKEALLTPGTRDFNLISIKHLLNTKCIAMGDTAFTVRRLKGNASDKFLEVVQPIDLRALLHKLPLCTHIATTGEKAATVLASLTGTEVPKTGTHIITSFDIEQDEEPRQLSIWRLPSTSRAYPLALEKKAVFYQTFFRSANIL